MLRQIVSSSTIRPAAHFRSGFVRSASPTTDPGYSYPHGIPGQELQPEQGPLFRPKSECVAFYTLGGDAAPAGRFHTYSVFKFVGRNRLDENRVSE